MDLTSAKLASSSRVEMAQIVLPGDANARGTAFGGRVVQWMDLAAAVAAHRHARMPCVTVSIDQLTFLAPIRIGAIVTIHAQVNAVFASSMEIEVVVEVEDPDTGDRQKACDAFLTFVALGPEGKPSRAPLLLPQTEDEVARAKAAEERRAARLASRRQA